MRSVAECSVVDLFCGAGGLTHGFIKEGFKVVAGIDCDEACRHAYEANNGGAKFIRNDITKVKVSEILDLFAGSDTKVLVGCAPCQPFSQYAKKHGGKNDKWKLLGAFADLVEGVKPHIVSMENVPELAKFKQGRVLGDFVDRLERGGYHVTKSNVYCPAYGIPQKRTRLVLFASLMGPIDMVSGTYTTEGYKTVHDAISHLPAIEAGGVCIEDPLHRAAGLTKINLQRIQQSAPGGTWRDWEEDLVADCHKRASGESYDCVYGRMRWDEPAPTITTQCDGFGNGRFGHPEQNRAISMREAALLQSFPSDYAFLAPDKKWHVQTLARMIGNAVPVLLARAIAETIRQHLGR